MQVLALDAGGTAIKADLIGPVGVLREQRISPMKAAYARWQRRN